MSLNHGTSIVRNGLVLHLDAANKKSYAGSGTTWVDLSSSKLDSSLINGVGYDGQGLIFDGVDDYGSLNLSRTASGVTYEAFLKPTNVTKDQMYLGSQASGNYLRILNSKAFISIPANGQRTLAHTQTLLNNSVYHIVSTYDGIQLKTYVNGNLTVGTVITQPLDNIDINRIGRWRDSDQRSFVGNLYCVRIYDRELSAVEINQNFEALRGRYGI